MWGAASGIISSIDFSASREIFATTAVTKKITLYRFPGAEADAGHELQQASPPPIARAAEWSTRSKLSCICWNRFDPNQFGSSDYEGRGMDPSCWPVSCA